MRNLTAVTAAVPTIRPTNARPLADVPGPEGQQEQPEQEPGDERGDRQGVVDHALAQALGRQGHAHLHDAPEGRQPLGDRQQPPLVGRGEQRAIEVVDRRRRRGAQGPRDRAHRHREHRGDHQPSDADRHVGHDEVGEILVGPGQRVVRRPVLVEHPEPHADRQEQSELRQDHEAAGNEGPPRRPLRPGRQVALDHHLVGAVGGRVQHQAADHPAPEAIRLAEHLVERQAKLAEGAGPAHAVEPPVDHPELVRGRAPPPDLPPAAGDLADQDR